MSAPGHKPARKRFYKSTPAPSSSPYALRNYKTIANHREEQKKDEEEDEMEWSYEEDLYSDENDDDYDGEDYSDESEVDSEVDFDEIDDTDYDSDIDDDDDDDNHEYLEADEDIADRYRNNHQAGPGYFYPEQPYIDLPVIAKPDAATKDSSSKLNYYILSPLCDIATIYIKFAILAILIYACALWYTVHYADLSWVDDGEADTCPANLST